MYAGDGLEAFEAGLSYRASWDLKMQAIETDGRTSFMGVPLRSPVVWLQRGPMTYYFYVWPAGLGMLKPKIKRCSAEAWGKIEEYGGHFDCSEILKMMIIRASPVW